MGKQYEFRLKGTPRRVSYDRTDYDRTQAFDVSIIAETEEAATKRAAEVCNVPWANHKWETSWKLVSVSEVRPVSPKVIELNIETLRPIVDALARLVVKVDPVLPVPEEGTRLTAPDAPPFRPEPAAFERVSDRSARRLGFGDTVEPIPNEVPVASQSEVDRHAEKQGIHYAEAWRYFEREGYDMSEVDPQYG